MRNRRTDQDGTYVTSRVGKGAHVVKTITTPAGAFRTVRKDVFERAMRSANAALKQGAASRPDFLDDGLKR